MIGGGLIGRDMMGGGLIGRGLIGGQSDWRRAREPESKRGDQKRRLNEFGVEELSWSGWLACAGCGLRGGLKGLILVVTAGCGCAGRPCTFVGFSVFSDGRGRV